MPRNHLVIPDCQVRPGVPIKHLDWIGKYIADKQPDVIVNIGDFADMPSLSSYDKGKKSHEGRRYKKDLESVWRAMEVLLTPIAKVANYNPKMVLTLGNHCERINRAVENNAELEGTMSVDDLAYKDYGWDVKQFLEVVTIDGVAYSHFFPRSAQGKVCQTRNGAPNAKTQLVREGRSCTAGHSQGLDIACLPLGGRLQWGLIAGSCLTPDHKVLTADLRYVPLGTIKEGDKLVSFDEYPNQDGKRSRRYLTGTVEKTKLDVDDLFEVTLASGKVFKVTADHLWLTQDGTGIKWTRTDNLKTDDGTSASHVVRLLDEWDTLDSYEAGWLSGLYDGEGCLYKRTTSGGTAMQLSLSQKEGPVLARARSAIRDILQQDSTTYTVEKRDVGTLRIKGGTTNIAKILGQLRPSRLLPKFEPEMLGRVCNRKDNDAVVHVKAIEKGEICRIAIDTKTMIVEGYGHHNCYLHDETYLSPQGNKHWRGVVLKNGVSGGSYSPIIVDLDYLKRRYE